MPVKLGGSSGGGNLTFTETTGTALETLVAGDQVELTKDGGFVKNADNSRPYYRNQIGGSGSVFNTWIGEEDGTIGTGSTSGNYHVTASFENTTYRNNTFFGALSNGWGIVSFNTNNQSWTQNYYYLKTFNMATGALQTWSGGHVRLYHYSFIDNWGWKELKNDGTYTWAIGWNQRKVNTGTKYSGWCVVKVKNSNGYIVGAHSPTSGATWATNLIQAETRSMSPFSTMACMAEDIVCVPDLSGGNASAYVTYRFHRIDLDAADTSSQITSFDQTENYNIVQETVTNDYAYSIQQHQVFVLNSSTRTFMFVRRLNNTYNNTNNRLQYKILSFDASGISNTTNVNWTTFPGSDEGGELAEAKMYKGKLVRISDNNFAAINSASATTTEVQKFTWNGSAIAENGSKYTITHGIGSYFYTAGDSMVGNIATCFCDCTQGNGDQIYLMTESGASSPDSGNFRYMSKLDLINNTISGVDFNDVNGAGTYGDANVNSTQIVNGALYFAEPTTTNTDLSSSAAYITKYNSWHFDIQSGVSAAKAGEVSTGAAQGGTATVQLFQGITSGSSLNPAYYATKENMQYLMNVDGAPPAAGGVVYPTINKVNVARINHNESWSGVVGSNMYATKTGSIYHTTTTDFELLAVQGAGCVNECHWGHTDSSSVSHHTQVLIDGVIVYGTQAAYDNYSSGSKPNHNNNFEWSLSPATLHNQTPVSGTLSHPITFKRSFVIKIMAPPANKSWICYASITKFATLP